MSALLRLQYQEPVGLDLSQLEMLYRSLGPAGADKVVAHSLEDISTTLEMLATQYRAGEINAVRGTAKSLIALAQRVGMTLLARVGRDVLALSRTDDGAAFAATVARLGRIGEGSLVAMWDLQDLNV